MPIGDFGVEGVIEAVDSVSGTFAKIRDSIEETSDEMRDASDDAGALNTTLASIEGGAEVAEQSVQDVEDEIEDLTADMGMAVGATQSLNASLASISGPDEFRGSPFGSLDASEFFESRDVRESFVESLGDMDDVEESLTRATIGGALEGDIDTLGEFTEEIGNLERTSHSTADAVEALKEAGDEPFGTMDIMDSLEESSENVRQNIKGIDTEMDSVDDRRGLLASLRESSESARGDVASATARTFDGGDPLGRDDGARRHMMAEGIPGSAASMAALSAAAERAESSVDDVDRGLDDMSVSSLGLSGSLVAANSALEFFILSLSQTERSVDDVEDEINQLTAALAALGPALSNVSANLGPFNFSLENLIVTIPSLIAAIGPLVATVVALAGAFVAASAAIASFAAVGAFGFIEQLQENFASITTNMEAVEAIASGLGQALREAVAPLMNVEFAGMSEAEFFLRLLQDLIYFIHITAEAFADILQLTEVEDFFLRIESALLGLGETSGPSMLEAMKEGFEEILPIVTDVLVFLIDKMPEFILFVSDITNEVVPVLADLGMALLNLSTTLTEFGSVAFQYLIPGLTSMVITLDMLVEGAMRLMDVLGPLGDGLILLGVTSLVALAAIGKVASVLKSTQQLLTFFSESSYIAAQSTIVLAQAFVALVAGIALIAAGLYLIEKNTGLVSDSFAVLAAAVEGLLIPFIALGDAIGAGVSALENAGPVGRGIVAILETLTGVLSLVIGSMLTLKAVSLLTGGTIAGTTVPSLWSLVTALWSVQTAMTVGVLGALIAMGLGLQYISDNFGSFEAAIVGSIAVIGAAFAGLVASVVVGTTVMRAALISSGVGAAIVGIGIAILLLIEHWEELEAVVDWAVGGIMENIGMIIDGMQSWIDKIEEAIFKKEKLYQQENPNADQSLEERRQELGVVGQHVQGFKNVMDSLVPSFQQGGYIEQGGLAFLHSNEYVIPANTIQDLVSNGDAGLDRSVSPVPMGSSGGGTTNQVQNQRTDVTVNIGDGNVDEREARRIANVMTRRERIERRRDGFQ